MRVRCLDDLQARLFQPLCDRVDREFGIGPLRLATYLMLIPVGIDMAHLLRCWTMPAPGLEPAVGTRLHGLYLSWAFAAYMAARFARSERRGAGTRGPYFDPSLRARMPFSIVLLLGSAVDVSVRLTLDVLNGTGGVALAWGVLIGVGRLMSDLSWVVGGCTWFKPPRNEVRRGAGRMVAATA